MISLASCKKEIINSKLEVEISSSSKFTDKEINSAINTIKENFTFPNFKLNKIIYDEEISDSYIIEYLNHGKGSNISSNPENIIVIVSAFDVDSFISESDQNIDNNIKDYSWILIREDKNSEWIIKDKD